MPRLTETLIRQRSNQILVEKTAKFTVFNSHREDSVPRLAPKGEQPTKTSITDHNVHLPSPPEP